MISSTTATPTTATARLPILIAATMKSTAVAMMTSTVTSVLTRPMPTLLTSDSPQDSLTMLAERRAASSGPSFSTTSTGTTKYVATVQAAPSTAITILPMKPTRSAIICKSTPTLAANSAQATI